MNKSEEKGKLAGNEEEEGEKHLLCGICQESLVGEGTYGAVYKGRCTQTGRTAAIGCMDGRDSEVFVQTAPE